MTPWEQLGQALTPEGKPLTLHRRGQEYAILAEGRQLMSSRTHGSELELAALGCERAKDLAAPQILVGGLGLGFTLRAALDRCPATASVVVAELLPAVVDWNRGPLAPLAGEPLADPRVRVELGDVARLLRRSPAAFDAILLDVDNGPSAFTQDANGALYQEGGLSTLRAALRPGGVLAVWSAFPDRRFEERLRRVGFQARSVGVRAHAGRGAKHTVFLGISGASSGRTGRG